MKFLSRDGFSTRGPGEAHRQARDQRAGVGLFALLFLAGALMVFSRLELEPVRGLRWRLTESLAPVLSVAARPVAGVRGFADRFASHAALVDEVEALRRENQHLRTNAWRASELERKLAQLVTVARTAEETGIEFATARVVAESKGPFASSLLVDAGTRQGVRGGMAVVVGGGLVGRVVDLGETAARVLLLDDTASRIPVEIGRSGARAIVVGDGARLPRLVHVGADGSSETAARPASAGQDHTGVRAGDEVFTSGDEGHLPRGLKVGVIELSDDGPRVAPIANRRGLEFVGLLFHSAPRVIEELARLPATERSVVPSSGDGRAGRARTSSR